MTWMILICHLPERAEKLRRLTRALDRQKAKHKGVVDYKINDAGRSMPTGIKRNMLIEQTQSDYINFIDDDDEISENYVDEIVKGMETGGCDNLQRMVNGVRKESQRFHYQARIRILRRSKG